MKNRQHYARPSVNERKQKDRLAAVSPNSDQVPH